MLDRLLGLVLGGRVCPSSFPCHVRAHMSSPSLSIALQPTPTPHTRTHTQLDLRSNNIGEQGLVALAESLALASHLQVGGCVWGGGWRGRGG